MKKFIFTVTGSYREPLDQQYQYPWDLVRKVNFQVHPRPTDSEPLGFDTAVCALAFLEKLGR